MMKNMGGEIRVLADEAEDNAEDNLLSLTDLNDPRSVVNMVTPRVREWILEALAKNPDLAGLSEDRLYQAIDPDETMDKVRLSFWNEYVRAQDTGKRMYMRNVIAPVMSAEHFYDIFMKRAEHAIWMICRPEDYFLSLEAMLNEGKKNLKKILKADLYTKRLNEDTNEFEKVLDTKAATIFLKAYELVENRVKGAIVNRLETKNLHKVVGEGPDERLRKELEELRKKQIGERAVGEG